MSDVEATVMRHLEHLCVKIGSRPVGSKENQQAASYIQQVFEACGLEVARQEFPCPLWKEIDTQLDVGGERLHAVANTFSPPCDITLPAVGIGTVAELAAAELKDRIGVLYGDLTKDHGIGSRKGGYFPEHPQTIMRLLEEKHPPALITISPRIGCLERLIRDWEFSIPSVTVSAEAGLRLLRRHDHPVHLRINSHSSPSHFDNIIAQKSGIRPERIVLLDHFDTMADTPGASDNGSGVAILLTLAELLSQKELTVGLEWIVINGEEIGGVGDVVYMRQREGELAQILSVINIDGTGQQLGANAMTVMGASQSFQDQMRQIYTRYPEVVWTAPWYESDHSAFLWRGVPCIPITSAGAADITHRSTDSIEWMSSARLRQVVALITDVIESLQDKTPNWCREPR
jgi:aminopeptidase YwaD